MERNDVLRTSVMITLIILLTPTNPLSSPVLQPDDTSLKPREIGTQHPAGYTLASSYIYNVETDMYIITDRMVNATDKWAKINWHSARFKARLAPKSPKKSIHNWPREPWPFEIADLPTVENSVTVRTRYDKFEFNDAPAFTRDTRVIGEYIKEAFRLMTPITLFSKLIGSPIEVEFVSKVEPVGSGRFKYTYLVKNFSDRTIYFKWASFLHPDFPGGWQGTLQSKRGATIEESIAKGYKDLFVKEFTDWGRPIAVNDIASFNNEGTKYFPNLEDLAPLEGNLIDRIMGGFDDDESTVGLTNLSPEDENTIITAPAFIPEEWLS